MDIALPTREHFVPVLVTLGSSIDRDDGVAFPITGWLAGVITSYSIHYTKLYDPPTATASARGRRESIVTIGPSIRYPAVGLSGRRNNFV